MKQGWREEGLTLLDLERFVELVRSSESHDFFAESGVCANGKAVDKSEFSQCLRERPKLRDGNGKREKKGDRRVSNKKMRRTKFQRLMFALQASQLPNEILDLSDILPMSTLYPRVERTKRSGSAMSRSSFLVQQRDSSPLSESLKINSPGYKLPQSSSQSCSTSLQQRQSSDPSTLQRPCRSSSTGASSS